MQIQSINQSTENATSTQKVEQKRVVRVSEQRSAPAEARAQSNAVRDLLSTLAKQQISLSFTLDNQTNQVIVRLIDEQTGDLIRQIPNDVSLKLAAVNATVTGQLVNGNF